MTTKGSSRFAPTRYEKDAVTQVWLDRRILATVCAYMEKNGEKPKFISEIIRFCVEAVNQLIVAQGGMFFDKTADATAFLEDRFGDVMNKRGKGRKNLMNNLLMDSGYVPETPVESKKPSRDSRFTGMTDLHEEIYSTSDIAAMKERARQQFGDSLAKEREDKDSERLEEEKEALESFVQNVNIEEEKK